MHKCIVKKDFRKCNFDSIRKNIQLDTCNYYQIEVYLCS